MAENDWQGVLKSIWEGNMLTRTKILVWSAYNFEKMPKTGLRNVADVYSESSKNRTNGNRDLKYG